MAGSRLPQQLFLQGVAAAFLFAFASLYTQIPGGGGRRRGRARAGVPFGLPPRLLGPAAAP